LLITCPKCNSRYQLKDETRTGKVKCKKCQTVFVIKSSAPGQEKAEPEAGTVVSAAGEKDVKEAEARTVVSRPEAGGEPREKDECLETDGEEKEDEKGPDPLIGKKLGGYEIIRKLGEGGMGAVYEARQVSLDRSVALKILPSNLAANRNFITRFTREALSAAKLNHTNIVQIYDVGNDEGFYYFTMEYVVGTTLQGMIEDEGCMDPTTAVGYVIQAARGLEYAHRKNIIHRDIKPENIMVNEEGVAKIADLGLAKKMEDEQLAVTQSGIAMGTPYYMAPEQATDAKHVDNRADIYSLGCTLYHLITGQIPYEGSSAYEIITKHVKEPLVLPHTVNEDVAEELSKIVEKMMAKTSEERFQSMKEVIGALEEYLGVNYAKVGFQPSEDQIRILQNHAKKIEAIRNDKKSRLVLLGICSIFVVFALVSIKSPRFEFGLVEYAALSLLFYFLLFGSQRKTYLYRRIRKFLFGNRISDWVVILIIVMVVAVLLIIAGMVGATFIAALFAAGTAGAYYWAVKRPLLGKQDEVVEDIKKFLREIRKKGIPEEDIHLFICQHGGSCGELICEEVFGYEALSGTRSRRSPEELEKRNFTARAREWLAGLINSAEEKREKEKIALREAAAAPPVKPEAASEKPEAEIAGGKGAPLESAAAGGEAAQPERAEVPGLEGNKLSVAAAIMGVPGFILGGKGRVSIGAVMILLAGLSFKGFLFGESEVLTSYNYILFAAALLVSGFARSRVLLVCLALSCLVTGPLAIYAARTDSFLGKPLPFPGSADEVLGRKVAEEITPVFISGLFFLIIGFIGAVIFKAPKAGKSDSDNS